MALQSSPWAAAAADDSRSPEPLLLDDADDVAEEPDFPEDPAELDTPGPCTDDDAPRPEVELVMPDELDVPVELVTPLPDRTVLDWPPGKVVDPDN